MGLDRFLGGDEPSDDSAQSAAAAPAATATDAKPADTGKPDATASSASSAEQATTTTKVKEGDTPTGTTEEAARARDEHGRFKKADAADDTAGLRAALRAERQKRQELERAQAAPPEKPRDFWADPEGALNERDARLQAQSDARFYDLCEERAKERHEDFDEIIEPFMEECQSDPSLGQQVFAHIKSSKDPAEALYRYAANRRELQKVGGDLGKYKAEIEAPHLAKIKTLEADLAAANLKLKNLSNVPQSLNTQGGATPATAANADGEEPLTDIIQSRRKRA